MVFPLLWTYSIQNFQLVRRIIEMFLSVRVLSRYAFIIEMIKQRKKRSTIVMSIQENLEW